MHNVVSKETNFTKNMALDVPTSCVKFATYCGKNKAVHKMFQIVKEILKIAKKVVPRMSSLTHVPTHSRHRGYTHRLLKKK